ncbi:MAG TPA: hypothetical protein VGL76_05065 [Gaiellaceae bacterium]
MAAHWVSRCDGFRVVVGRRDAGTVERTVFDEDPLSPVALRVRRPHGRSQLIPLSELEGIEPLTRVLYFHKRPGRGASAGRRLSAGTTQLRRGASRTRAGAMSSSQRTASLVVRNSRRHWPSLRSFLIADARVALAVLVFCVRFSLAVLVFVARTLVEFVRGSAVRARQVAAARRRPEPTPAHHEYSIE